MYKMRFPFLAFFLALSACSGHSLSWGAMPKETVWGPVPKEQVDALVQLFESTGGKDWKNNSGWESLISPCEWYGVRCRMEYVEGKPKSSVIGISLSENGLIGPFPSSIVALHALEELDLMHNELTGPIPASITSLPKLKHLNVALNKLGGKVPEELLVRWDNHQLDFRSDGNSFSEFVIRARIEYAETGLLCADRNDVRYVLDVREWGYAKLQSIRCTPDVKQGTYCLVREGKGFALDRFSRALVRLKYSSFKKEYSYPFTFTTHQASVKTTVWWGDGSTQSVEMYGKQGPIDVWIAQELFVSLLENPDWVREYTRPTCEAVE
jgi:hypothetical protein